MPITHAKVSGVADGPDTAQVRPSDWNAAHTVTLAAGLYTGNAVAAIANNGNGYLTWDSLGSGDAVLDLTAPLSPTIVAAGVYAITAIMTISGAPPLSAGGGVVCELHLDMNGEDAVSEASAGAANIVDNQFYVQMTVTYYVPAGGLIKFRVYNFDGVNSITPRLREASVQRVA